MAYRLLKTSELSSVPVGYSLETADLFQFTVGTQTAGPSLSTVKLEVGELMAWSVTPSNTYSLWVSGTDDNVYNRSGGNVGIGTTSNPEVKLTVSGPISSRGEGTFEGGLSAKGGKGYFSGDVGIGTAVPAGGLHVKGGSTGTIIIESSDSFASKVDFYDGAATLGARVQCDSSKNLELMAGGRTGADMIIHENTGHVGIGTTNPDATLTVHDRLNSILGRFQRNDSSDYVTGVRINALNGVTHTYADICVDPAEQRAGLGVGTSSAGLPIDKTDLSKANIVWDTSGNVGIGTEDPGAKLDVAGAIAITGSISVGTTTEPRIAQNSGDLYLQPDTDKGIYLVDHDGAALMVVKDGGNVGIGTTSPDYTLEVAADTPEVSLEDTSSSAKFRLKLNGVAASITNHGNNGDLTFATQGTGDFIFSNGKVGIGTDAPTSELYVKSLDGSTNSIILERAVGTARNAVWNYNGDFSTIGTVGPDGFKIFTNNEVRMTVASNGASSFAKDVTFDGDNVNINGGGTLNMTATDYAAVEMRGSQGAYIDFKTDGSNYLHRIAGYADHLMINTLSEEGLYLQATETDGDDTLQTYMRLKPSATTEKKDGEIEVWKTLDFSDSQYWSSNGAYQPVITVGTELGKQICTNLNADMLDGNHATAFGSTLGSSGSEAEASKNWKLQLLGSDSSVKSTISIKYAEVANKAYSVSFNNGLATNSIVQFNRVGVGTANTTGGDGSIVATGDIVGFSTSDRRFKTKIKPISNSLDILKNINGVEFEWNNKQELYKGRDVGVIAQELEQAIGLENVVKTRDDGYKAVRYEKLIPVLIEAVKTLSERVETLEKGQHGKI